MSCMRQVLTWTGMEVNRAKIPMVGMNMREDKTTMIGKSSLLREHDWPWPMTCLGLPLEQNITCKSSCDTVIELDMPKDGLQMTI
ncbi:hypothetical protein Syun_012569 [Stephania yunnanensis]|uniref:Uncharacterized protein n=1 Tax=Stephania yunnanensis TaxID=152371 RepID=A0AAP0PHM4_9MAGN